MRLFYETTANRIKKAEKILEIKHCEDSQTKKHRKECKYDNALFFTCSSFKKEHLLFALHSEQIYAGVDLHLYDSHQKMFVGHLSFNSSTGIINQVSVNPKHFRKGFGTEMVRHCIDRCIQNNVNLSLACWHVKTSDFDPRTTQDARVAFFSQMFGTSHMSRRPTAREGYEDAVFNIPPSHLKELFPDLGREERPMKEEPLLSCAIL